MLAVPIIQRVDKLSLGLRTITVHTTRGTTINGVGVDVTSCCQVKIQGWSTKPAEADDTPEQAHQRSPAGGDLHMDYSAIRLAAQHFIGKNDREIEDAIQKTIAGHQRAIIGGLTVEELYKDRSAFSKRVLDLCWHDMRNMGLTVVSYTVAEITDELGYIEALGVTQTEVVKREATEGAAQHQSQAKSRKAQQEAAAHLEVNKQQERKIDSDKLRAITQANAQQEIDRRVAVQQKAHDIATAEQDAVLFVERQKARAAEAEAELLVMKQKVAREKLIKEQLVNVEADAKLYKATVEADGIRATASADANRVEVIGEAQAGAEATKIRQRGIAEAEAHAKQIKEKGLAEAEVVRATGMARVEVANAEAGAIRAKGMAEVDVLRERLQIWNDLGNAGVIMEKMIEILPKVAANIAAPLAKTEKMVFVGGGGGGGGPSQFTKEMNRIVAEVPETVQALTGVNLSKGLYSMMNGKAGEAAIQGFTEGLSTGLTDQAFHSKKK